ncbi:bifunctional metallophosphatase/5'-nucleotidase [Hujiaoplasma nucleasis]|uniref:Bifunctional metallophosphatase/5'-nucleotidase n=1 Tax=Hujiaoplasma nucleasis TaxID=2725268 RepID=A0A7L6N2H6_9MOLU|nr:bifunctional UDP-sugar hydrolase/5'-nucleotidase [Hujiaoplasma nucleasis]QLY39662.1 bifunctional metallophosphatase/5'-nucleotidase [Hujiaoplasma nucleasis]
MKKKILSIIMMVISFFVLIACNTVINDTNTTNEFTNENTTELVTSEEPTSLQPTTEEISTDIPTNLPTDPTTEEVTEEPTTEVPTEEPTTLQPTTSEPTTEFPTEEPTQVTTEEPTSSDPIVEINLFSINDFHGGAYTGMDMMSRVGYYLKNFEGNHLEISNGDIFQGSALSNYYQGRILVDILNEAGFDGFTIGNHEFDWGIDIIGNYQDNDDTNGELNHPILAANIVYEDTGLPLEFTLPYMIEEFEGVRVGVIGLIGSVMNSIAASRTENILFLDPVDTAAQYASELRENHDVDIVVVYIHQGSEENTEFANLSGSSRIDAMFNAHTHQLEASYVSRALTDMPYAQMNNYDSSLVHISLTYDKNLNRIIDFSSNIIENDQMIISDSIIDQIILEYSTNTEYTTYINEVLTISEGNYYRNDMAQWGASVIRDYAGVDVGATNAGGFRVSMEAGQVTMGDLMTIYPFDNVIKTSEMTGQQLTDFYLEVIQYNSDVVFDDGLYYNYASNQLFIDGGPIVLNQYYTVGAVDYIFDKTYYDFLEGQNIRQTIYFMRDLLVLDLKNATDGFNPSDGSHY